MSVKAMSWAFEQTLRGTDKAVLLALANFADERGYCWPSHKTLADHAGCWPGTIKRSLARLEARGYIMQERRTRPGRGLTSNGYLLALSVLVFKVEPKTQHLEPVAKIELPGNAEPVAQPELAPVAQSAIPGSSQGAYPVAHSELGTTLNRHFEPSMNQGARARTTAEPLWNQGKHVVPSTERVRFVDEQVLVSDDYRAEWEDRVGGRKIFDLALIEIAGSIQQNALKSFEVQVSRHLSIIARKQIEQDRRYLSAAKTSKTKPETVVAAKPAAGLTNLSAAEWEARIAMYAGKVWGEELGPPPGDPKCLVPTSIIRTHSLSEKYDPRGLMRSNWKPPAMSRSAHA
jgi:hypothetical protein